MAQEEGKLISVEQNIYNGVHTSWTPPDGKHLWNWNITVEVKGVNRVGQVLTKAKDSYPIALGTIIIFETDWVENYGKYKFKGVKDKAKADSFKGGKGGKKFNKEQFINETVLEIAINYLKEQSNFKEMKLTNDAILDFANGLKSWLNEDGDLFIKKKAYLLASSLVALNMSNANVINTGTEFIATAKMLYSKIIINEATPVQPQATTPPPPNPQPTQSPQGVDNSEI